MQTIPDLLLAEVRDRYGVVADRADVIGDGTASKLWRLDSEPPVVVRLSHYIAPDRELDEWLQSWRHRSDDQAGWIHWDFFPGNALCIERFDSN